MKHACPACNCHLGQYALVGFEQMPKSGPRPMEVEGLIDKVLRLSAELRKCRAKR